MSGILYVVGTPIGNLSDLSPRAVDTLRAVDFIAAEDTRVTLKLLNHFEIKKPMVSYHEHNLRERGQRNYQPYFGRRNRCCRLGCRHALHLRSWRRFGSAGCRSRRSDRGDPGAKRCGIRPLPSAGFLLPGSASKASFPPIATIGWSI